MTVNADFKKGFLVALGVAAALMLLGLIAKFLLWISENPRATT